eukprot:TRINITY_DN99846_c0_g1_i4.p1 TRINITY_DN99846_c0_g1~~TRINITY_DN99846_c0_g1_i4.p1  ORF type:complete len:292 (-),score=6.91 TRINITY_DN99846_c0_g1_i4:30-905(-)
MGGLFGSIGQLLVNRWQYSSSVGKCLLLSGGVILGINSVGFLITMATQTHKITDLFGTGAFVVSAIATHSASCHLFKQPLLKPTPSALATACVALWGTRLAGFLFYRILQTSKDDRLDFMFKKSGEKWFTGPSTYPLKLLGFWSIQSLWGWGVLLPITVLHGRGPGKWSLSSTLFMASFFVGWLMETVADYQKFVFKSQPENKDKWIQSGLYRYCRYPNYFGEILVWWSFYGFNLAQGPITSYPWTIFSPLLTMLLLTQVSGIPLQESSKNKRYKEIDRDRDLQQNRIHKE